MAMWWQKRPFTASSAIYAHRSLNQPPPAGPQLLLSLPQGGGSENPLGLNLIVPEKGTWPFLTHALPRSPHCLSAMPLMGRG